MPPDDLRTTPKQIRRRAGLSLDKIAAQANVSGPTARIYEINPLEVKDERKRQALDRAYAAIASADPHVAAKGG